ncbi:hypothetical protein [Streptomyces mirabilis]|uniref:hypothetical protein n=1 Tax=Streptomyces mirabilis TaxID=68239 RepID=UPI00332E4895
MIQGRKGARPLTPDAARVVVACASPYHHQAFRTADLADDGRHTTSSYPDAVAIAPDGTMQVLNHPQVPPPSPCRHLPRRRGRHVQL